MTTTAAINYSAQCQLGFVGSAPIFGGRLSFSPGLTGSEAAPVSATIAREITFADLTLETGNYTFRIETDAGNGLTYEPSGGIVVNLLGDAVEQFTEVAFIYIDTNSTATITGLYPTLPPGIDAGGVIMVHSQVAGDAISGAGDTVLQLSWTAAAIAAVGSSNFRAHLIIVGTL